MTQNLYQQWDIWYAPFAFEEDPNQTKDRPVLIISTQPLTCVVLKITSAGKRDDDDYEIQKWQEAGLDRKSYIRINKRVRMEIEHFRRKIGRLQDIDILLLGLKLIPK